ncbi:MAG: hypothetical protein K9N47_04000 [Prosthecobacter sp.]|uniref:hypothetical protein n=1 Tax=Prosthecobacter sp. TaxID=1965333 RepID=UPI0025F63606|nr:hypothetical protein [Prosthecobacter sp.]MCF7785258.1 hypothetical protein [Prosthecobacter sp.]
MSQPDPSKKAGATFTWVLGAFAGFAVLFILIQSITDSKQGFDPREDERHKITAEILNAQAESIAKLGLDDEAKKKAVFKGTLAALKEKKTGVSTQVVPGSPTQLKQAAAAAAPAPAAPASPATAPAPAPPLSAKPEPPIPTTFAPPVPATPAPAVPTAPAPAPAAPASPK